MKFLLIVAGVILLVTSIVHPVPLNDSDDSIELEYGNNEGSRQCNLSEITITGVSGKVNHAACAAYCLSMGKAGGRCNNGNCQCRKTTFKDLWNKRFG